MVRQFIDIEALGDEDDDEDSMVLSSSDMSQFLIEDEHNSGILSDEMSFYRQSLLQSQCTELFPSKNKFKR